MGEYYDSAKSDAKYMAEYFEDSIVERLLEQGSASSDINNDYPQGDEYHHESHVDRWYSLLDAAKLLDELSQYEETDSGMWEGQHPRDAISTQAAYTYGNAVMSLFDDLITDINGDLDLGDLLVEKDQIEDALVSAEDGEEGWKNTLPERYQSEDEPLDTCKALICKRVREVIAEF